MIDLDVTSPLRKLSDIKSCINLFIKQKANNLITIYESRKNPYFNMIEKKRNKMDLVKKRKYCSKVDKLHLKFMSLTHQFIYGKKNIYLKVIIYFQIKPNIIKCLIIARLI